MGSAQYLTDPFLAFLRKVFWQKSIPDLPSAIFAATWTLQHAIDLNVGGVDGPIRIAVLEKDPSNNLKARKLSDQELDEHRERVNAAEEWLRSFELGMETITDESIEDIPERQSN